MGTPTTHSLYRRQLDSGFTNLRFIPTLEQEFRSSHFQRFATTTRTGMLIAAAFYALYMILLWFKAGAVELDPPSLIRIGIILALIVGGKYIPKLDARQHMPVVMSIYFMMSIGIIAIEVICAKLNLPTRYEGILLSIIHCCFFSGLLFRQCSFIIVAIIVTYAASGVAFAMPLDQLAYQTFFCVLSGWMGLTAVYIAEQTERENFLNRQLMNISANFDELTGLATRGAFDRYLPGRLRQHLPTSNNSELALILVDIDYFKQLNDSRGHDAGDKCLKLVADILAGTLQQDPHAVARWGGDELIAVVHYQSSNDLLDTAESLRKSIENLQMLNPGSPHRVLTVSIGVVMISSAQRLEEKLLFRQADAALYLAKQQGRNQVVVFEAHAEDPIEQWQTAASPA